MLVKDWDEYLEYEAYMWDTERVPLSYNEWCKDTGRPFTRSVSALDAQGYSLLTVSAYDDLDALDKLGDQLTRNPSRIFYFTKWEAAGFLIKWKEDNND